MRLLLFNVTYIYKVIYLTLENDEHSQIEHSVCEGRYYILIDMEVFKVVFYAVMLNIKLNLPRTRNRWKNVNMPYQIKLFLLPSRWLEDTSCMKVMTIHNCIIKIVL